MTTGEPGPVKKWDEEYICLKHDCSTCPGCADELFQAEKDRDTWQAMADRLAEGIRKALRELGVPQPGYPAPVTMAVVYLNQALTAYESSLPKPSGEMEEKR